MNALSSLERDCIYSGELRQDVRCLVWLCDIGIRYGDLVETDLGYEEWLKYCLSQIRNNDYLWSLVKNS
jgi:hypothetical protein